MRRSAHDSPNNVKGIDCGEFVLMLAKNKLVIAPKGKDEHITVHFGPISQILDIHKTCVAADGSKTYTTLFSISHKNLLEMMQGMLPSFIEALKDTIRPLHLEFMTKERMGAVVGLLPSGKPMMAITKLRNRKLSVDVKKLAAQIWTPEFLEDLYELEDGEIFTIFSCKNPMVMKKIGHGFSVKYKTGRRRLFWIPEKKIIELLRRSNKLILEILAKHEYLS